jgi:hypothetical protein
MRKIMKAVSAVTTPRERSRGSNPLKKPGSSTFHIMSAVNTKEHTALSPVQPAKMMVSLSIL